MANVTSIRKFRDDTGRFGLGNPGKPKGAHDKLGADVKRMILTALSESGGVEYLKRQAEANPRAFLALLGRVLPYTVASDPENPLRDIHEIHLVAGALSNDDEA